MRLPCLVVDYLLTLVGLQPTGPIHSVGIDFIQKRRGFLKVDD